MKIFFGLHEETTEKSPLITDKLVGIGKPLPYDFDTINIAITHSDVGVHDFYGGRKDVLVWYWDTEINKKLTALFSEPTEFGANRKIEIILPQD